MKELGVKVLNRIENLISVIEKKPGQKTRKVKRMNVNQQEHPMQQKTQHNEYLRKLSYSFVEKKEKTYQKLKQQVYKQEQVCQPFKVSNKTTKAILNKKSIKPIYERVNQIINNKMSRIQQLQRQSLARQHQELFAINQSQDNMADNSYSKGKSIQIQQWRQEVDQKNHKRIKKMHLLQLNSVKKELYNGIPSIATSSRSLSKIYNDKKQLSYNVFQRLNQDNIDRNRRKILLAKKTQRQQGGYSPYLCQKSRALVNQGKAKRQEIHLDRSVDSLNHYKCKQQPVWITSQKGNKHELSLINPQIYNRSVTPQESKSVKASRVQKLNLSKSNIKQRKQQLKKPEQKVTPQKTKVKLIDRKSQFKELSLQTNKLTDKKTRRMEESKKEVESMTAKRDKSFKKL